MLKVWNLSLIVGTFALTVLGTFLTRGSILASVHAFADSIVGPLYLAFLTVVLLGGFGLIAWRRESLRGEATPETDGREGLRSLEILIAIYLSARDSRRVALPLEY